MHIRRCRFMDVRCFRYYKKNEADSIFVHSKEKNIIEFTFGVFIKNFLITLSILFYSEGYETVVKLKSK